ncbi:MAG: type I DNA topoisomerase [Candidatus Omnitrophica bacterium]|nr:type I DNA topoisomerase [Candidatus Omnitrophota bacterium]
MVKSVVIVESPTKVKTISKILGSKFKVLSSMGHLVDLPKARLGVDIDNNFAPDFIVVRSKMKLMSKLKAETKTAKDIFVATDPDREGEAIGWNLVQHIGKNKKIYRVSFQEITKDAILEAFKTPRDFDENKINAQVARRILDRIVGYQISPLLWKKVGSRLSAGRVQSVALRILVEREREIKAFNPQEYWQIAVDLKKSGYDDILTASLEKSDGAKIEMVDAAQAQSIAGDLREAEFVVSKVTSRSVKRNPSAPFITSTLQQEAFNQLRFNAARTMRVAQELYEGIELGGGEVFGLITYMRTDSVNISQQALIKLREFIDKTYGADYCPAEPNQYKSRKSAQEAHEAIRPTDILLKPKDIAKYLDEDQYKLYSLIFARFVCSQMTPAVYEQKKIEIEAGKYGLGASGSTLVFDGFLTVDREAREEETRIDFSHYEKDDRLTLLEVKPTQHFTKPPPRFSDASLVKILEEYGIGRPSTYASIIQTLVLRNYVLRDRGYFTPTELGITVCDLLVQHFGREMDVGFTAKMEENLDEVESGAVLYPKLLGEFYAPFQEELKRADAGIVKTENFLDKKCPLCERPLVEKWGRRGKFLSCSGFPACRHAEALTSGVKCLNPGCAGELIRRRSKWGQYFYGCSRYPECTFISNDLPAKKAEDEASSPRA